MRPRAAGDAQVETPDGAYALTADWLIAADGARSAIRRMMNLDSEGRVFLDRFLIADVVMKAEFPAERWFWFDPFHPNQSVLLHRQADNVYRIDFQLWLAGRPGGREEAGKGHSAHQGHARRRPRIRARMGQRLHLPVPPHAAVPPRPRPLRRRCAHQVSPFGAAAPIRESRTATTCAGSSTGDGRQGADSLLDSYSEERVFAADENIANSTRSTDFITPKPGPRWNFRNAVLTLAGDHPVRPRAGQPGPPFGCRSFLTGRASIRRTTTPSPAT